MLSSLYSILNFKKHLFKLVYFQLNDFVTNSFELVTPIRQDCIVIFSSIEQLEALIGIGTVLY